MVNNLFKGLLLVSFPYILFFAEVFARHPSKELPNYDEFHSMKKVKNCVEEAVRMRSAPIIVRKTQQPTKIGKYTVCCCCCGGGWVVMAY